MTGEICRFWLIVTGKGEEEFLPDLFRGLTSRGLCTFKVIYRMPQSDPITSPKRLRKMVRKGQKLTTRDEDTALKIRRRLYQDRSSYAMIVDDIERARREGADKVFARYRTALDTILTPVGMQSRASVHFLVNMLEAYYFAHSAAVNAVAGVTVLAQDHATDVEQIAHPKGELKACWKGFDEIEHGRKIVPKLDLEHILARPAECCGLRTMIAWCVTKLIESDVVWDQSLATSYQLADGCRCPITSGQ